MLTTEPAELNVMLHNKCDRKTNVSLTISLDCPLILNAFTLFWCATFDTNHVSRVSRQYLIMQLNLRNKQ